MSKVGFQNDINRIQNPFLLLGILDQIVIFSGREILMMLIFFYN